MNKQFVENITNSMSDIFNQLQILSAHVYAIEEILINKGMTTEEDIDIGIEKFIDEVELDKFETTTDNEVYH